EGGRTALGLRFVGSDPHATVTGRHPRPGTVNYLIGSDPSEWHTGLPTYGVVAYRNPWPGTSLAFRGDGRALRYDFRVAPGADPGRIRLAYRGVDSLSLDGSGNLVLRTEAGTITDARPLAYQDLDGQRVVVPSRYVLGGGEF